MFRRFKERLGPFPRQHSPLQFTFQPRPPDLGFTIVEVMVSMIIVSVFLTITMQIFLTAAFLRAKAVEYNEAYNWIQEDFEKVLIKAKSYDMQSYPYSPRCGAAEPANGFAAGFMEDEIHGLGGTSIDLGQRTFGGQTFSLIRTADYTGTIEPHRLLHLTYGMTSVDRKKRVLELDTRVVLYAAFNCPSTEG